MNRKKIGKEFEKEAIEYLYEIFDKVEWLSEKEQSSLDFRCKLKGKEYFGDAKIVNNGKPQLKYSQRNADFVIFKLNEKVHILFKSEFDEKISIEKEPHVCIGILRNNWVNLVKIRLEFKCKTLNDVITLLIDTFLDTNIGKQQDTQLNKSGGI